MNRGFIPRVGTMGGALFVVLVLVADFTLVPQPPQAGVSPQTITTFLTNNQGGLRLTGLVEGIATAFLLWFAVSLSDYLRNTGASEATPHSEDNRMAATLCLAGGLVAAILNWIWSVLMVALAAAPAGGAADSVYALYGVSTTVLSFIPFPGFLFLAAFSLQLIRSGSLSWLGWAGFVAAVFQLLSGIGATLSTTGLFAQYGGFTLLAFLLLLAWLLLASVVLTRRTWTMPANSNLRMQQNKDGKPYAGQA